MSRDAKPGPPGPAAPSAAPAAPAAPAGPAAGAASAPRSVPAAVPASAAPTLADQVGAKASRKLRARRSGAPGVWFGLGMMGLIGWSVALPTLLGAALGLWIDQRYPGGRSWTLALLVGGLAVGCLNAWHWVSREDRAMRDEQEGPDG